MEAVWASETLVSYHNAEDLDLYHHRRESLKTQPVQQDDMIPSYLLSYCFVTEVGPNTRVYPKVSGLATCAVVSLFCDSV
jgi:hypothetical protein